MLHLRYMWRGNMYTPPCRCRSQRVIWGLVSSSMFALVTFLLLRKNAIIKATYEIKKKIPIRAGS